MARGHFPCSKSFEMTVRRVRSTADRYCSVVDSVHSRVPADGVGRFSLIAPDILAVSNGGKNTNPAKPHRVGGCFYALAQSTGFLNDSSWTGFVLKGAP